MRVCAFTALEMVKWIKRERESKAGQVKTALVDSGRGHDILSLGEKIGG